MSEQSQYTFSPGATGYYWMRWRRKWGRLCSYDIVWVSEGVWKSENKIRHPVDGWQSVLMYRNARFYGPVRPPPVEKEQ